LKIPIKYFFVLFLKKLIHIFILFFILILIYSIISNGYKPKKKIT